MRTHHNLRPGRGPAVGNASARNSIFSRPACASTTNSDITRLVIPLGSRTRKLLVLECSSPSRVGMSATGSKARRGVVMAGIFAAGPTARNVQKSEIRT